MLFSYIYQDECKLPVLLKDVMKFCSYSENIYCYFNPLKSDIKSGSMLLIFYKVIPY